jgi:hypothetical protein
MIKGHVDDDPRGGHEQVRELHRDDPLRSRERWLQALSIDPETGLDPPGYKVRAAQGLDAAVSDVARIEVVLLC